MPSTEAKVIHVAAAIIQKPCGEVLIARRPDHAHQGGKWEFPGGKREIGETIEAALIRELQEELGITPTQFSLFKTIQYDCPEKTVLLDFWRVTDFEGQANGREGQEISWVDCNALNKYEFPPANQAIVGLLNLPSLCFITPEVTDSDELISILERVLSSQNQPMIVQLRQKKWSDDDWLQVGKKVVKACRSYQAFVVLNGQENIAREITADGVHMTSVLLQTANQEASDLWRSASCHSLNDLQRASNCGCDFVFLSPVKVTQSHPEAEPLGWGSFSEITRKVNMPVFALGGLVVDDMHDAINHGAHGVAAIRGFIA